MASTRPNTQPGSPNPHSSPSPSSPNGQPRPSRIRFPADSDVISGKDNGTAEKGKENEMKGVLLSENGRLLPPPSPMDEALNRRRVFSANAADGSPSRQKASYSRAQFVTGSSRSKHNYKRTLSHTAESSQSSRRQEGLSVPSDSVRSRGPSLLEDDTNAPDDPNILADLQKALRYKSRVEEHLKASLANSRASSPLQGSSSPSRASPISFHLKKSVPSPPPVFHSIMDRELVDFSPSVAKVPEHPVPTSNSDGAILDWSGTMSEDDKRERKWSMPLGRKGSKDKYPHISNKALMQKQQASYSEKLERIRSSVGAHTLRKAEITRDQLDRRYSVLNASSSSSLPNIYPTRVVRWYANQDDIFKRLVEDTEPMSWLRHLLHGQRPQSPWHLSALIVEEYVRSNSDGEFAHSSQNISAIDVASNGDSSFQVAVSRPTSSRSVDLSSMRRKSDDLISFEPTTNHSRRASIGADSKISNEGHRRRWRHSLTVGSKDESSPQGSMQSKQRHGTESLHAPGRSSPLSTRSHLRNIPLKKRIRDATHNSEEGQSSALDSSDGPRQAQDDQSNNRRERKRSRFHLSLDIKSAEDGTRDGAGPLSITDLRTDALPAESLPKKSKSLPADKEKRENDTRESLDLQIDDSPFNKTRQEMRQIELRRHALAMKRRQRVSLPSSLHSSLTKAAAKTAQNDQQEQALKVAYGRKKETLETMKQHNQRMKYLLQSGTKSFMEFDDIHHFMADKLGLPYTRIPTDVLDAFNHDPAAVTGPTRRLSGWRAVEDIHLRLERQRDTLLLFTSALSNTIKPMALSSNAIYDEAITTLSDRLDQLHVERSEVLQKVRRTNELVAKVKELRDKLKPEFDEAGRTTSANYPELVRLESLLDEFTNQKNQLWKIGEAAISFVLTSVAPLMKTFGRPIWDELHDFLVIPIYRNDFSGEDHWYPVTFPRRSFFHWLRLISFSIVAPLILKSGVHLFISLLTEGYLLRIPDFIPWFLIYFAFSGIMFAFAVALFVLLVAVLCEFAIILWWSAWILCIVK